MNPLDALWICLSRRALASESHRAGNHDEAAYDHQDRAWPMHIGFRPGLDEYGCVRLDWRVRIGAPANAEELGG